MASDTDGAKLSIETANTSATKEIPNTGGLKKWQVITVKNIQLKAGSNKLKVNADKGGYNLHSLQFWLAK